MQMKSLTIYSLNKKYYKAKASSILIYLFHFDSMIDIIIHTFTEKRKVEFFKIYFG